MLWDIPAELDAILKNRIRLADQTKIKEAYEFAKKYLENIREEHRQTFFENSIRTARRVAELNLSTTTVIATILHHTLSDGGVDRKELEALFGKEVADIVNECKKLASFTHEQELEFKKLIVSMSQDPRIALVVLCDRVTFMEELENFPKDIQEKQSRETLDFYAPLSHKLGLTTIRNSLENYAFKFLYPDEYAEITKKIDEKKDEMEKENEEIKEVLKGEIKNKKIKASIQSRIKHAYGVWQKMQKKNKTFDEIYDINALRVITKTVKECYEAIGIVHSLWRPLPGEFDDYIAKPKENHYQSIHTTVIGPNNKPLEIQIRTEDMHKTAEYGVAIHWKYKGHKEDKKHDKKIDWLKQMIEWKNRSSEFIDSLKVDFFEKNIYVFTPKGEVIELSEGATALDFAYAIHTDIGSKCKQIKVDGKLVPLSHILNNGEHVEVITSNKELIKRNWLNLVKTYKARKKIQQKLNLQRSQPKNTVRDTANAVLIRNTDTHTKIAHCCNPVSGDEVIGLSTTKRKISVHRTDCERLQELVKDHKIRLVKWGKTTNKYSTELEVVSLDKPGILSDILKTITGSKVKINSTNAKTTSGNRTICVFGLEITDLDQLEKLIKKIEKIKDVKEVSRV